MRNGFVASIAALIAMLALSTVAVGQAGAPNAQTTTAKAFDPHDLSGYWDMRSPSGTLNTVGNNRPPMTAWGKAKFSKVKTGLDGKQLSAEFTLNGKIGMIPSCGAIRQASRASCGFPHRRE